MKKATSFTYLGSAVTNTNSSDAEIDRRIQAASKAYGALHKILWSRHDIRVDTKVKVYNVAVLPALLYGTECMTLYKHQIRKLTAVQLRHMRQLLQISWESRVSNVEVLRRANSVSVEAMIASNQLRWAGHVVRMPNQRLPKTIFYGELSEGTRKRGAPNLRFKDTLKRTMKVCKIDDSSWTELALNRGKWRNIVHKAKPAIEKMRKDSYTRAHLTRHQDAGITNFRCGKCLKHCRSKAGLAAHTRFC